MTAFRILLRNNLKKLQPEIKLLSPKKLIGKQLEMSFSDDRTVDLWKNFMPRRSEIGNTFGTDLFSLQIYETGFFETFHPNRMFEKWAAVEVSEFDKIPDGMKTFTLQSGQYAVFHYKGSANDASEIFGYIFTVWLPDSEYILDNRPHFEILGEKYKKDDPESEEEIWIPIKPKS